MDIKPIKTVKDYRATLREIEGLMRARANTPDSDRLDVLVTLVEAYERVHYPMDLPDAVEAIKFRMEQQGLTVAVLRSCARSRVAYGSRSLHVSVRYASIALQLRCMESRQ